MKFYYPSEQTDSIQNNLSTCKKLSGDQLHDFYFTELKLLNVSKIIPIKNHFGDPGQSHFTTKNNTRVIAQKGSLAVLPCVVKISSPATVSWIRRKDFQLLTVGLSTHSSDKRFLVEHARHMGHWSLRIKSVRESDRGLYECQLSIYPTESIFVELKVVVI
ncbi:PREDICTED: uncharacterized protein LOC108361705 [Rhagoletis zephyria]|uniref:uncharacterized protein LOC108361705 n=1 Tax=Rhagoletis zephyria TaxID=28612 RepID=UPI0008118D4F|nr:PREDICTED: uncharacterized protein LOC108361705 [Rhagoletis zephyria]